jgi:hypothetical protein
MNKFQKLITKLDLFGHQVNLYYNRKDNMHKTLFGGLFSILVGTVMLIYVIISVK